MAMFKKIKKKSVGRQAFADTQRDSAAPHVGAIAYRILRQPHVTEKAGRLAEENQYVFRVDAHATKPEIRQAIYEAYGVRALSVTTLRIPGKRRRLGGSEGRISGYKKAIVTLPEGKTIEVLPK